LLLTIPLSNRIEIRHSFEFFHLSFAQPPRLQITGSPSNEKDSDTLASMPPMGWNSWDSFGATVTEADIKANAAWMAQNLKAFGWQYVVVDMEWFVTNPIPEGNGKDFVYSLDENGRYIPDPKRFPSSTNGAGFKPLADYVHSLGLKFGIHILRGIPKQAVEENLPITESAFRASAAANRADTCPWNFDNYGTDASRPAAQAYYDSIAQLYASWGVDLLKVDCIASHPYKSEDIRMLSLALRKTGRPIVLSLSPGEAPIDKIDELREHAQMWRISDDVWDLWHSTVAYPQGLNDQFPRAAKWASETRPGHWPDADMLPLGYLGPAPGWGTTARNSRLTHDEQRTLMTLWCIFRSPLMLGGNLPRSDEWMKSLLTNPEVFFVDQRSNESHQVIGTDEIVVWLARAPEGKQFFVAVFNRSEKEQTARYEWKKLGLVENNYKLRDLWQHRDLGPKKSLVVPLAPHSCVLYRLAP
jgi:alpha-galactosidase